MSILTIAYLAAALLVALYGGNALLLSALYLRRRRECPKSPSEPIDWPPVTVQLPIYNELYVTRRLIDAVAHLDYPRDRLQVQVLDDSTDETTRLASACVNRFRRQGLDIELIHRANRTGYKAGALARGLETSQADLVAIFDADFVPEADFLRRSVPYLASEPHLGFVQARWGYLNHDYSALTRAQAIALDGHFVVEHLGRNRNGLLMNFNGTAGIWRRQAIEDAGGWQSDTLTEDVDLSFRAQLAGWQALYLPDLQAPAELPPQMAAFKRQQARWATGAAQCLLKLAGPLMHGTLPGAAGRDGGTQPAASLSWPARLEALLHLSVWIAHPMSLLLLCLTLPMLLGQIPLTLNLSIFWLMALGPILANALSARHLYPGWRRRFLAMPVLALLGTGLALSNTVAIARGLIGADRAFYRTPKFRVARRGQRWAGRRYALPFQWLTVGELLLAGYALATVGVAVSMSNWFSVPFLLLYVAAYGYLGLAGLGDLRFGGRARHRLRHREVTAD